MRVVLFFSFLLIPFILAAQTVVPPDSTHYFSVYSLYYSIPDETETPASIVPLPDGNSNIGISFQLDRIKIWPEVNEIVRKQSYLSFDRLAYEHLMKDAPGSFSISDLVFNPRIKSVNQNSWNREPLLSLYLWSEMHFVNSVSGYMHCFGKIYKTTDAGNHWSCLLDSSKVVENAYYSGNCVYAVLTNRDYIKVDGSGSVQKIGRFKSGKHADQINTIQFQNDSTTFFLVGNGLEEMKFALYKSVNDIIQRKPLMRNLPGSTKMVVTTKSIIIWEGGNVFYKSDDGGETWVHYLKQDASNSLIPQINLQGLYVEHDSIVMGFGFSSAPYNPYFSIAKLLFDRHLDSMEAIRYKTILETFNKTEKVKHDSLTYCKCRDYAASIQNHRQIENGTFVQTQLTYLSEKAPELTLKDGKFWYNPKAFNKESTKQSETMPETKGAYIASENSIAFTTDAQNSYFKGAFNYMFDGNNFYIYKCDLKSGQTNMIQFHNFGKENVYNPPVPITGSIAENIPHASDYLYSFTSDSNKFTITLTDLSGRPINDASIKFDDIYATPIFDGQYYFDKRTLKEYNPLASIPTLIIISHPDYDPLLISYPTDVKKYILQKKKKK